MRWTNAATSSRLSGSGSSSTADVSYVSSPGSFLFAWPLAFALAGFTFVLAAGGDGGESPKRDALFVAASAAPGVALVAPLVYMFFVMLGLELVGLLAALPVLVLGLCVPLLRQAGARRWLPPAVLTLAGLAFVVSALASAGFDAGRRKTNNVFYVLDADANRARFLSTDGAPDEWTSQFITGGARRERLDAVFPWSRLSVLTGEAPAAALPAPGVEVLEDRAGARSRTVRLRLTSPRGAPMLLVHADAATVVRRAVVNNRPFVENDAPDSPRLDLRLSYAALPREGVELTVELEPAGPLRLVVQDVSFGLPELPGRAFAPRPAHMMPTPDYRASDTTIVRRTFNQ